tara:strand:+ start:2792 stop:5077 length:2286 start_codon:yes stop_codon:yes gene_type:complete
MKSALASLYSLALAAPRDKPLLPRVIQFPVNDICNSKCQMCEIWKQKKSEEVSPDALRSILTQPLFREVRGIGFNGGEPTLRPDLPELIEAAADTLPKLGGVSLITNAIRAPHVIRNIDAIGSLLKNRGIHLDVMVSLDGVGDVHDRVRGRAGNFASAVQVLEHLRDRQPADSFRIGCTIIRENVLQVEEVLNWAQDFGVYARFRVGIPHQRLYTAEKVDPFALTQGERFHLANFLQTLEQSYETNLLRRHFYHSLRRQVAYGENRTAGCDWKDRGVTLFASGDIGYCAVKSRNIASPLRGDDALAAYHANVDHLREIRDNHCATCHHDYEGIPNRAFFIKSRLKQSKDKIPAPLRSRAQSWKAEYHEQRSKRRLRRLSKPASPIQPHRIPNSDPHILLCGWYGTETLGDRAILAGVITAIREANPSSRITIASLEPYVTEQTQRLMPELEGSSIISYPEALTNLKSSGFDSVLMAGGPLMSPVNECLDILELFHAAKSKGIPTGLFGGGVGPLQSGWRSEMIAAIIRNSDHLSFRDSRSLDLSRKLTGADLDASVIPDPSRYWLRRHHEALKRIERDPKRILFGLRDWHPQVYANELSESEGQAIKDTFEAEIKTYTREKLASGYTIIPFCMHKQPVGGDDRFYYQRLFQDEPEILRHLDWQHRPPGDDFAEFHRASFALTMRFHSTVFALEAEIPFLAIDYTRGGKVGALCEESGLADQCLPIDQITADSLQNPVPDSAPRNPDLSSLTAFAEHCLQSH